MKKKVKDLTIGEFKKICNENSCTYCPLKKYSICSLYPEHFSEIVLNQEIEVEEDE